MMGQRSAKGAAAAAMAIFGTIGLFRRWIDLPSGMLALVRAVIGAVFLMLVLLIGKRKPDKEAIKKNFAFLCLSGACLGGNWLLLFEAYNHTSVAAATLCYEMGPVIAMLAAPLLFGERAGAKKWICSAVAIAGVVLSSGILGGAAVQGRGIALALGAACLYAGVMLLNRRIGGIEPLDRTVMQLCAAAAVMLPYVLIAEGGTAAWPGAQGALLAAAVGVIHTGLAYALYFGALGALPTQTAALMSYIDPALAVLLSAAVLKEPIGASGVIGAVLVIGAAIAAELPLRKGGKT